MNDHLSFNDLSGLEIDAVLISHSNEQLAHLVLFMPWIKRFHIHDPDSVFANLENMYSQSNRFICFKQKIQHYSIFAPFLADHFLLIEDEWKPHEYFFPCDFFHDRKPIIQNKQIVPFSRIGFNQAFHFIQKEPTLENWKHTAIKRGLLHNRILLNTISLKLTNVDPVDVRFIAQKFESKNTKWNIVILGNATDIGLEFYNKTIWVQSQQLVYSEKLKFLKRVIARKGIAIEVPKKVSELQSVFVSKKIRELIGFQELVVHGECALARRVADIFNVKCEDFVFGPPDSFFHLLKRL